MSWKRAETKSNGVPVCSLKKQIYLYVCLLIPHFPLCLWHFITNSQFFPSNIQHPISGKSKSPTSMLSRSFLRLLDRCWMDLEDPKSTSQAVLRWVGGPLGGSSAWQSAAVSPSASNHARSPAPFQVTGISWGIAGLANIQKANWKMAQSKSWNRWFTHSKWWFSSSLCKRLPEGIGNFIIPTDEVIFSEG